MVYSGRTVPNPATWPNFLDPRDDENLLLEKPSPEEQLEADWATLQPGKELERDVPDMPKEDLKAFVLGACDGTIFTSAEVRKPDCPSLVFLPLAFGMFEGWSDASRQRVGILWEYLHKALPRGINGYPCFGSCRMMNVDDWKRAHKAIVNEMHRRKTLDMDLG